MDIRQMQLNYLNKQDLPGQEIKADLM